MKPLKTFLLPILITIVLVVPPGFVFPQFRWFEVFSLPSGQLEVVTFYTFVAAAIATMLASRT